MASWISFCAAATTTLLQERRGARTALQWVNSLAPFRLELASLTPSVFMAAI